MELTYLILSFSVKYHVDYSRLREYDDRSELFRLYTQPGELVESGSSEIVEAAREVVGSEANPHQKALLTYNFVVNHLRYEVQKDEMGAQWALKNGVGGCSEYSYLFNQAAGKKPSDKQTVQLKPISVSTFPDGSFAETVLDAVQRVKPHGVRGFRRENFRCQNFVSIGCWGG